MLDEPADIQAAAELPVAQADERRAELERAGDLPKGWPAAYPEPRDWKSRLAAARTLELTWETDDAMARRPAATRSAGTSRSFRRQAIGDLAATVARWRREGLRVVLTSDQSARLSEILSDADIVAAPVQRCANRRRPVASSLDRPQPQLRLCRRPG